MTIHKLHHGGDSTVELIPGNGTSEEPAKFADESIISADAAGITSIYDLWTARRYRILLTISIASIMVPFTDTIYLPALQVNYRHVKPSVDRGHAISHGPIMHAGRHLHGACCHALGHASQTG